MDFIHQRSIENHNRPNSIITKALYNDNQHKLLSKLINPIALGYHSNILVD